MISRPGTLLRIEGLTLFGVSILLYRAVGTSWGLFFLLFLSPDISMVGYLAGTRLGATVYNLAHTEVFPIALASGALFRHWAWLLGFALIWSAHIGFDRMLGFGLKYPTAFKDTHLQRVS